MWDNSFTLCLIILPYLYLIWTMWVISEHWMSTSKAAMQCICQVMRTTEDQDELDGLKLLDTQLHLCCHMTTACAQIFQQRCLIWVGPPLYRLLNMRGFLLVYHEDHDDILPWKLSWELTKGRLGRHLGKYLEMTRVPPESGLLSHLYLRLHYYHSKDVVPLYFT